VQIVVLYLLMIVCKWQIKDVHFITIMNTY